MVIRVSLAVVLALAISALIAPAASADVFTFDIPSLNSINNMDLGMTFSGIKSVGVNCTGRADFGLYMDMDSELRDLYPEAVVSVWNTSGQHDEGTRIMTTEGIFANKSVPMPASSFDIFKGGKFSLLLDYDEVAFWDVYSVASHSSLTLSSAQLVIDGTAVPEPVSIAALACGLVGFAIRRRK